MLRLFKTVHLEVRHNYHDHGGHGSQLIRRHRGIELDNDGVNGVLLKFIAEKSSDFYSTGILRKSSGLKNPVLFFFISRTGSYKYARYLKSTNIRV
jgi:hypothetical protein